MENRRFLVEGDLYQANKFCCKAKMELWAASGIAAEDLFKAEQKDAGYSCQQVTAKEIK